jgi:hypothetical protein
VKQKRLKKQLLDPSSLIQKMSAEEIHASDPRYSNYPIKIFTTNLRNLKKSRPLKLKPNLTIKQWPTISGCFSQNLSQKVAIRTGTTTPQKTSTR